MVSALLLRGLGGGGTDGRPCDTLLEGRKHSVVMPRGACVRACMCGTAGRGSCVCVVFEEAGWGLTRLLGRGGEGWGLGRTSRGSERAPAGQRASMCPSVLCGCCWHPCLNAGCQGPPSCALAPA